jgi:hypothetical protein
VGAERNVSVGEVDEKVEVHRALGRGHGLQEDLYHRECAPANRTPRLHEVHVAPRVEALA